MTSASTCSTMSLGFAGVRRGWVERIEQLQRELLIVLREPLREPERRLRNFARTWQLEGQRHVDPGDESAQGLAGPLDHIKGQLLGSANPLEQTINRVFTNFVVVHVVNLLNICCYESNPLRLVCQAHAERPSHDPPMRSLPPPRAWYIKQYDS